MNQVDTLLKKLRDPSFRARVKKWAENVVGFAANLYEGDLGDKYGDAFDDLIGNWPDSLEEGLGKEGHTIWVFGEFLDTLPEPRVISDSELASAFDVYFMAREGGQWRDFDEMYDAFIDQVEFRLLTHRSTGPFDLCQLYWDEVEDNAEQLHLLETGRAIGRAEVLGITPELPLETNFEANESDEAILWATDIVMVPISIRQQRPFRLGSAKSRQVHRGILVGQLMGRLSEGAMQTLADEVIPITRSLLRSASLVDLVRGPFPFGESLPFLSLEEFQKYRAFIASAIRIASATQGKKDTMERRLCNAARLLSEADDQSSNALSLALSVTALESLLGRKGSEVASSLAERIATLVEPELARRTGTEAFVKSIYDLRSRTLHGEALDNNHAAARSARVLAACCLYGVWFRYDFKRRLGEKPDTPDELLKELKDQKYIQGQPGGIPNIPAAQFFQRPVG